MLERDLIKKIKKYLDGKPGVWYFKTHGSQMQQAGIPDLILCVYGIFMAIEVKTKTGTLTKLQEYTIQDITKVGRGIAGCVWGYDDFVQYFDKWYKVIQQYKFKTPR